MLEELAAVSAGVHPVCMRFSPFPPCSAVRTFLIHAAVAGLLGLQGWAAEEAGRTFGDSVGLNVKFSQGQPMSELPLLKELGVKWVRDSVDWPVMEPEAGKYADFPPAFRERLIYYKENGIGVVFGLWYANAKAYPNTPEHPHHSVDAAAYGRYAAAMVRLLRESGVRFVLEVWNEPHNFVLKKMLGGEWQGKPPSPWVDHYVAMVRAAVTQVKAADPQARLLAGDDMWVVDDWFLEKGLPPELDALGVHPYAAQGPEMTAVDQATDWAKPFTLTDADRSLRSAVRRLREQAHLKMGRTPAIWATEWGWKIGDKTPHGPATEDMVAALLPRTFISSAAAGVEVVCWFSMQDSVDGAMGLRKNDGKSRPAYAAFRTMTNVLGNTKLMRQISGQDHPVSGVQGYLFHGPDGWKLAVWNIDGESVMVLNRKGSAPLAIQDVQGRPVPATEGKDGRTRLKVSPSPIYVAGLSADVSLEPEPLGGSPAPAYLFP